uniref:Uncharacterized protein n=1 Tax=Heterorhabditis bacteriophora TaxID=37862 RepID=A0A1I7XPN6_HETBA
MLPRNLTRIAYKPLDDNFDDEYRKVNESLFNEVLYRFMNVFMIIEVVLFSNILEIFVHILDILYIILYWCLINFQFYHFFFCIFLQFTSEPTGRSLSDDTLQFLPTDGTQKVMNEEVLYQGLDSNKNKRDSYN